MKFLTKTKYILLFFFISILVCYSIKQQIIYCDTTIITPEKINRVKEALYEMLSEIIYDQGFINKYEWSNVPSISIIPSHASSIHITLYYSRVMCSPEFLETFLNDLPLQELMQEYTDKELFLEKINELFYIYVETRQKDFEGLIKSFVIILSQFGISCVMTMKYLPEMPKIFITRFKAIGKLQIPNEGNIIRDKKEGAFIKLLPRDVKELFEYKKQLVREKDQHLRQALEEQMNKKNKEKIEEKLKQKTGAK